MELRSAGHSMLWTKNLALLAPLSVLAFLMISYSVGYWKTVIAVSVFEVSVLEMLLHAIESRNSFEHSPTAQPIYQSRIRTPPIPLDKLLPFSRRQSSVNLALVPHSPRLGRTIPFQGDSFSKWTGAPPFESDLSPLSITLVTPSSPLTLVKDRLCNHD